MKLPSIKSLAEGTKQTISRFPVELLFALTGTIAAVARIELRNINLFAEEWCTRLMMMANLGLLLSLCATLYTESRNITGSKKWAIKAGAIVLPLLLLALLNPGKSQADYIRFGLLSLAFHLMVAYASFTTKGHIQGFWQFNKTLFLRFLTSALYGTVLYSGIAAALGAMNMLFNSKFEFDTFSILWVCMVGLFSTTFFLAGVPSSYARLENDTSYPKGLKIFTQYVLIPLSTIYLVILLAYEIKIALQWSLPKGYVSNLILGYAVFGLLSLLLVYPIRNREENKWLKTYARSFYFLMLPLLILLFLAVGARVFKYGITEERYFLIILALWLLFVSLYFLLFKRQNIKLIPISLSVATLISAYGPQSAFSIAQLSQTQLLIKIFKKHDAFKGGKLVKPAKIDSLDAVEAIGKLRYLITEHDLISLQSYFDVDLKSISDSIAKKIPASRYYSVSRYEFNDRNLNWAEKQLGLYKYAPENYYGTDADSVIETSALYSFKTYGIVRTGSYDYLIDINTPDTATLKAEDLKVKRAIVDYRDIKLTVNGEQVTFQDTTLANQLLAAKNLNQYLAKKENSDMETRYLIPPSLLTLTRQSKHYRVTLVLDNFTFGKLPKEPLKPTYVSGVYLIKKL